MATVTGQGVTPNVSMLSSQEKKISFNSSPFQNIIVELHSQKLTAKAARGSLATLPIGHLRPYPLKTPNTVTCDPTSFYCVGHTKLDLVTCDPTHPY